MSSWFYELACRRYNPDVNKIEQLLLHRKIPHRGASPVRERQSWHITCLEFPMHMGWALPNPKSSETNCWYNMKRAMPLSNTQFFVDEMISKLSILGKSRHSLVWSINGIHHFASALRTSLFSGHEVEQHLFWRNVPWRSGRYIKKTKYENINPTMPIMVIRFGATQRGNSSVRPTSKSNYFHRRFWQIGGSIPNRRCTQKRQYINRWKE